MEISFIMAGDEYVIRLLDDTSKKAGDLSRPFADFGERVVRKVKKRLSGEKLNPKTGRLRSSITYKVGPDQVIVSAGGTGKGGKDAVKYARILQEGGVIKPKRKRFLTIPFPGGPADRRIAMRASDFDDTFVAKGIIFQDQGEHEDPVALFILRRKVKIPARPYMYTDKSDDRYLHKSVSEFISGGWK